MKRSNVATYSGVYTEIRNIFGGLQDAVDKGITAKHFSFNTKGGRCENCEGLGYVMSNMLFFEDLEVPCPVCHGNRFTDAVLSVKYAGYSIKDVLEMSIEDAVPDLQGAFKNLHYIELIDRGWLGLSGTRTDVDHFIRRRRPTIEAGARADHASGQA